MSKATEAFFIVSSGRSGTAMLHKALTAAPDVEMHHEYMVHIIQPLAVRRYMGWASRDETLETLRATYGAAITYSAASHWGDSSNKASWLIPELAALFPDAKFVHLVRDGRKVASSYFHKLKAECYDDRSTAALQRYAQDPAGLAAPPPEKKYWWPLARPRDPAHAAFRAFDQFERIAWHWAEVNRVILASLSELAPARRHFVRLEELHEDRNAVEALFAFVGLACSSDIASLFTRPHNVNRPEDKLLDAKQRAQFDAIAQPMMKRLGYAEKPEYVVNY
ncbi:MAG TPA: sulfotransferase [Rhizomicrobium sp.]|nr:sulfotransferase [Rhizomicrobium sp.]